jgi:hypothetical protein
MLPPHRKVSMEMTLSHLPAPRPPADVGKDRMVRRFSEEILRNLPRALLAE